MSTSFMNAFPSARRAAVLIATLAVSASACSEQPTGLAAPAAGDWPVSTPSSVGLSEQPLVALQRDIELGEYGDVHSVLIVRNGLLVYEEYFGEGAPDELHRVYSVTKSVAATLIGLAWQRGLIPDLDAPLVGFFPEYDTVENPGPDKESITLRHALQMRAGLEWDEWSTSYENPANPTTALFNSEDWMKFMLDRPMAAAPGGEFVYNSGVSMLLSGVIKNVTGMRVRAFADEALFGPLGIVERGWWSGPNEIDNTGWGLHLRSRDMARIGQLYLRRGVWEGERLLSEEWIERSWDRASEFGDGTGYGFQWWLAPERPGVGRVPSARGWGGQFIVVVPHLDAVVVTTQGNYDRLRGLDPGRLASVLTEAAGGA